MRALGMCSDSEEQSMSRRSFWALVALLSLAATNSWAQDALEELYGRGVHAYFARNYREAHNLLDSAIASGSRDPRVYYFRGLAYARLGRPDEAKFDFRKAAELEILGSDPYPIARSLERVQGPDRIALELQRRLARLDIHNKQAVQAQTRYEDVKRAEGEALRGGAPKPAAAPAEIKEANNTDPFGGKPAAAPAPLPSPPGASPAPVPAAAAPPSANDPFGSPPPAAGAKPPPPPAAGNDPFGSPPPAAAAPPPPPPPMNNPPPPAPAEDPFGNSPAAPRPAAPTPTPAAPAPNAPAPTPT